MRAKIGTIFMFTGLIMLLASAALMVYNYQEQVQAEASVDQLMPQLVDAIRERQSAPEDPAQSADFPEPTPSGPDDSDDADPGQIPQISPVVVPEPEAKELPVVEIDGYGYIGFLTIPALELELPVMSDWSYPQLKLSPCRYAGCTSTDDLVIMAHNYTRHFGNIGQLKPGDMVAFTDMDGNTVYYEVIALDVLYPSSVPEMVSGEFDLTLFTCTYGGRSRVTVRCDRMKED